ncbi:MAG: SDR family NAD(P)-dependent oxidoreductase [Algibacter sp.]
MNKSTVNRIQNLLDESGLLNSNNKKSSSALSFNFKNDAILITGAAGTIGSGLVKQLLNNDFKKLILIDNAESPLYFLQKEFEGSHDKNVHFVLADIRDTNAMESVFEIYKPSIVFHTAAYKHVSLMEKHPYEAIRLNVFGTKLLADLAVKHQTKKFVFISTDKTVNPKSIMGITKAIAQNYLQNLKGNSQIDFLIVRFGNIFGSNGSVVPLFLKQIKENNQITIRNKKVSRYFISKTKACLLLLEITKLKKLEYFVFTFDMGKPIKINELANVLISNYTDKNKNTVEIKYEELNIEEKLHEDIISNSEVLIQTKTKGILYVKQHDIPKTIDFEFLEKLMFQKNIDKIKSDLLNVLT